MSILGPGNVISNKTGKTYSTIFQSLINGERLHDVEVSWNFDLSKANPYHDIDVLYDQRLTSLRNRYDILELSWGGGYDSSYLLEVSVRNNIPFDIITMVGHCNISDRHSLNLELRNNYQHIEKYLKNFPNTDVRFIDIVELCQLAVDDRAPEWETSYPALDDICGLYSDTKIGRKGTESRCVITGKGWKNVVYNHEHKVWSMYHNAGAQYTRIAHTSVCDLEPFYQCPDIILSVCMKAMDHGRDKQEMWCPSDTWMQKNVLYGKDMLPIWRMPGQKETLNHFASHEADWFCKNRMPVDIKNHAVYWNWIAKCNDSIDPADLGGQPLPVGTCPDKVKVIDFHK